MSTAGSVHSRHLVGGVYALVLAMGTAVPILGQTAAKQATPETRPAAETKQNTGTASTAVPLTAKEARDAQIAADTQKLLELAEELKVEVGKSSKDTLSLSVVRKAAEIEKLAHSLRERMKKE